MRDVRGEGPLTLLPPAGGARGGGQGRGGDSHPRQEAAGLAVCSSERLLAARPGLGCGRRGTGSVHRSGHRPGRGRSACAAGCCLQHRGEYGAPRFAGLPRGRERCGGCPAALGAPSWAALLCSAPGPGHGGHGAPCTPRVLSAQLLGFGHVCRGCQRGPVSREPRCQRSDTGTEPRRAPHLRRAAPRCRHRARAAEQPRHRSQRLPPAPLPTAPLPAPRPACSALLRCTGLRWENACPLGKRNVCEMFAIN